MAGVALITGGRGDLAGAIGEILAGLGYEVVAPGRDELDVTDSDGVREYFSTLGEIALLVNNAGVTRDGVVARARMDEERWDEVVRTNLRGAFLCSRAALRPMCRRRGGHIVNIGSFSACVGPAGQANYAAAKAGLVGLTQSLAKEVGGRNVRVNCVLPGYLKTKMTAKVDPEVERRALEMHALGRFNTVEDAAAFIGHLDGMESVSGQVFQLDSRVSRWC